MKIIRIFITFIFGFIFILSMTSCGDVHTHTYGSWTILKEATCEGDGEKSRKCTECDDVQTEVIKAKGHNYSNGVCTICGKHE